MGKKKQPQSADELLKKLQETVRSASEKKEKKNTPDQDELAFQAKLEEMLRRATAGTTEPAPTQNADEPTVTAEAPPVAEDTPPIVEDTPPIVEDTTPIVEDTTPIVEDILPVVEDTTPIVEDTTPIVEDTTPIVEDTTPIVEDTTPIVEDTTPIVEDTTPIVEDTTPIVEDTTPIVEDTPPTPPPPMATRRPPNPTPAGTSIPTVKKVVISEQPTRSSPLSPKKGEPEVRTVATRSKDRIVMNQNRKSEVNASLPPSEPKVAPPNDAIVIKPKPSAEKQAPIVIKPRRSTAEAETVKVPQATKITPAVSATHETPSAEPKAPTEATAVKPAVKPAARPVMTAKRSPGVSLPKSRPTATAATAVPSIKTNHVPPSPAKKRSSKGLSKEETDAPIPEGRNFNVAPEEPMAEELATASPEEMMETLASSPETAKKQSIFSKRRAHKEQAEEKNMNTLRLIEKKTGMTEDDIAMLFELGYDNELSRLVGVETLKRLKYDHIRKSKRTDESRFRTAFGYRNAEYTGTASGERILASYAHDKKQLLLRVLLTALILLLLLPVELAPLLGITAPVAWLFPALTVLLPILAALLSIRQLWAGLCSLLRLSPTPYSVNAVLVPIGLVYGTACAWIGPRTGLFGAALPIVGALLLTGLCDAFRLVNEMRCFRIVSAEGEKNVLDVSEPRKKKLRYGEKVVKIINDDVDRNLYRIRRSHQLTGFFRRCNDDTSAAYPFGILLFCSLGLSLLGGIAGAIATDSLTMAISAFVSALFFSTPVSAVFLFHYPLCHANRKLAYRNCTLIGEESVMEYSEHKTVIFRDSEMYSARKCTQISYRDQDNLRLDMRLSGILFRKISGTLESLAPDPRKGTEDPAVTFVRITENGVEAMVDNRYHMLAGSGAFLSKNGVRIPKESTEQTVRRGSHTALMYVAIGGELKLSYEIEYRTAQNFEDMVRVLAGTDTAVAIRSYDPNLNEAFLQINRGEDAEEIYVVKPGRYEPEGVREVCDSGVVALGSRFDTMRPLIAASVIRRLRPLGYRLLGLSSVVGCILSTVLILNVTKLLPGVPVLAALLYHGAILLLTYLGIRHALGHGVAENLK